MARIGKEFIDHLTNLYNRRYLAKKIRDKISESQEKNLPLSIVFIDIDNFKNINDIYGHATGDVVLKEFAIFLESSVRRDDMVFRYGGDEFICMLPNTDYERAAMISQRFIDQSRTNKFSDIRLTLSVGIASSPADGIDWPTIFAAADRNLYSAKRHGRDRIGVARKEGRELIIPTEEIIGRDSEIARIGEFLDPILAGTGGVVNVSGEVGVGKTRLIHEVLRKPKFRTVRFFGSALSATTSSIPYYPFREMLRAVLTTEGRKSVTRLPSAYQIELIKILPELSDESIEHDKPFMLDKFRLFEGIRQLLASQLEDGPLFLSFDDLNWADRGSLDLLHYLVRTLKSSPILFIFMYRVEEIRKHHLQDLLQFIARESHSMNIDLEPLEIADVSRMLSFILDGTPSEELTAHIVKETGGNPFFIEEMIKSLDADGMLTWVDNNCVVDERQHAVIPYSVQGVIDRKLSVLDSEALGVLEYGAVIGREFTFHLLQDVTQINEGHLFDLIDSITTMRLLNESEGEHYTFSEEIIREIVYRQIGRARLKRYHQIVGEKLASLHADHIDDVVEGLANHFYVSDDLDRAIEYNMIAADRAKRVYANSDAVRFFSRAIECLRDRASEDDDLRQIGCQIERALVMRLMGQNEQAINDLEATVEMARIMDNQEEEARCLIELCKLYLDTAQYDQMRENADRALELYRTMGDRSGEAHGLNSLGIVYANLGKYQKATDLFDQSLAIRNEINDLKGKSSSYLNIGVVHHNLGEYSRALPFFQDALKISREIGDRKGEGMALSNIGVAYRDLNDCSSALKFHKRALSVNQEIGSRKAEAMSLNNIGVIYKEYGDYPRSLEFYQRSQKLVVDIGDRKSEAIGLNNIGGIYLNLGEYDKALQSYNDSLRIVDQIGHRQIKAVLLLGICDLYIEIDDFKNAKKYCSRAYSITEEIKSKSLLADVLYNKILLSIELDSLSKAKADLEQLRSLAEELDSREAKAEAACLAALVHTKEGSWDKARNAFEQSISLFGELEQRYHLAIVYYRRAVMFSESGDQTNAGKDFAEAKRRFQELGAKGWLRKIEKRLDGLHVS